MVQGYTEKLMEERSVESNKINCIKKRKSNQLEIAEVERDLGRGKYLTCLSGFLASLEVQR